MKEPRSGGKRKPYYRFKNYFTSLTQRRFQETWEIQIDLVFKKYTYESLAQMPTWLLAVLIAYLHFFYSHGREDETGER